ncbi:hypothetical protein Q5752_002596 [Cryptotrichosporon argae]
MISRSLVAGPSRALARVRHASTSAEVPVAAASSSTNTPHTDAPTPASASSSAPQRGRRYTPRQYNDLRPIQVLSTLPRSNASPVRQDPSTAARTYALYDNLPRDTRRHLPLRVLQNVLRAVAPRFDDAEASANAPPGRARLVANTRQARAVERKLRTVVADMLAAGLRPALADWTYVLKTLARLGHMAACEAVAAEMPERLRADAAVIEQRLGAVIRRARNLEAAKTRLRPVDVQRLVSVLWDIFGLLEKADVVLRRPTLEMLLAAICRVRDPTRWLDDAEAAEATARIDALFDFVLAEGYGFDLKTLVRDESDVYAPVTHRVLNVILDHMRARRDSPYRTLTVFELFAAQTVALPHVVDAAELAEATEQAENEDDEIPTLSSLTAAEEAGAQRLDWLGRPKNPTDSSSTSFDASTPTTPGESGSKPVLSSAFLSPIPRPSTLSPSAAPPERAPYNPMSITHLLHSAAAVSDLALALQILSGAIHATHAHRAAWLASYLGTPAGTPVPHAGVRVSAKWFAPVVALSSDQYARSAARIAHMAQNALDWAREERRVMAAHHAASRNVTEAVVGTGPASAIETSTRPETAAEADGATSDLHSAAEGASVDGVGDSTAVDEHDVDLDLHDDVEAALPGPGRPRWADSPRDRRKLRSAGVLIVNEHYDALVDEIAELEGVVARAHALRDKRTAWKGEAWLGRGWGGKVPDDKVAAALADGLVHLDASAGLALRIHTAPPTVVELARAADGDEGTDELLRATFTVLSRPKDEKDKRELRQLRAKVVEQEAEIASLHAKLASARANVVRSSQASQSQKKTSPKKPPANASLLQPNVKRRKVVQDEFAGSDSD